MKIITHDENREAKEAVAFYKNSFIRKNDLYANSPKCHEHETYKRASQTLSFGYE